MASNRSKFADMLYCQHLTDDPCRFFRNKGAVAGVFLIAGLAAASIVLFLFFFVRRRRRTRRLELDNAMNSALAAHGFNRTPLDVDADDEDKDMAQHHGSGSFGMATMSSLPSGGARPSSAYFDDPQGSGSTPRDPDFDPYAAYASGSGNVGGSVHPPPAAAGGLFSTRTREGYMPARTSSPPPLGHGHNASTSTGMGSLAGYGGAGHAQRESAWSFEPLIAAAGLATPPLPATPGPVATPGAPPVPARNPRRPSAATPPAQFLALGGEEDEDAGDAGDAGGASGMPTMERNQSETSIYSDDDQLVDLLPRPLEV